MQLQQVGKTCKLADADALRRFAAAEKKHLTCITARLTPEQKSEYAAGVASTRKQISAGIRKAGCSNAIKDFYAEVSARIGSD